MDRSHEYLDAIEKGIARISSTASHFKDTLKAKDQEIAALKSQLRHRLGEPHISLDATYFKGVADKLSANNRALRAELARRDEAADEAAKDMRRQIDEANATTEQFKTAAENLNKQLWSEREFGAEGGAELAKLRNENRALVEGINTRVKEITRQQNRSLALLRALREERGKLDAASRRAEWLRRKNGRVTAANVDLRRKLESIDDVINPGDKLRF